jgi:ubiquinone/menaquinone biosynthesis C-methylase UbiE
MIAPQRIGEAYLAGALWWYAGSVLYPARALKHAGLSIVGEPSGEEPERSPRSGLGPLFSVGNPPPVLLAAATKHDHLVEEFDRMADVYDLVVKPFSTPIFDEAVSTLERYLEPDWRVLDTGCGPGRELRRMARLVPDGEVVGVDLAAGMVNVADAAARAAGLDNCAFFQADVGELPRAFNGKFDLVYNSLAHHHYPDPAGAAASVLRCLRPGGVYCIVDPGPAWFNSMSAGLARRTDPGWIGFHTPDKFRELLRAAGFARACWVPLLPGFGAAIGQKAARAPRRAGAARNHRSASDRRQPG